MKKYMILALSIIATQALYGYGEDLSPTPNYRVSNNDEINETFEKTAYEDLLRMVDEVNRQNGISSKLFINGTNLGKEYSDVKFIPVAQFTDNESFTEPLPERRTGNQKRIYFGNNNEAKNISIISTEEFEKNLSARDNNYVLNGTYKNLNKYNDTGWGFNKRNPMEISVDEYFKNIHNKSKNEVAQYLLPKLQEYLTPQSKEVIIKNGELYTKEADGKEWKILWEVEPVSVFNVWPEGYKDDVFTKIYLYDSSSSPNNSSGRIIYKKDGSILIEDKLNYTADSSMGKDIEFRGKGRIDGEINLGSGKNILTIKEQFTGKYGTNIILGAYAKLKNIDKIKVSGAIGSDSDVSLSGKTSLAIDIDPAIKNNKGHLIQHVFKDSDKNIIFESPYSLLNKKYKNDFCIEMMASKISEDSVVDMGRKLEYEDIEELSTPYKINLVSDTITHNIVTLDTLSDDGNTLVEVKIKDSLKKLTDEENKVYASIKNSGNLYALSPTLSTTNKKTTFSAKDDENIIKKDIQLAKYLREKTADDTLRDLSEFNFSPQQEEELKKKINNIKETIVIKDDILRRKEYEEYKKYNLKFNDIEKASTELTEKIAKYDLNDLTDDDVLKIGNELEEFYNSNFKNTADTLKEISNNNDNKIKSIEELANKISYIIDTIETIKNYRPSEDNGNSGGSWGGNWGDDWWWGEFSLSSKNVKEMAISTKMDNYLNDIKRYLGDIPFLITELSKLSNESLDKEVLKELQALENRYDILDYKELHSAIFYTLRQEEGMNELKTLISQVKDKNIYSRLNKITKDEMKNFTDLPFNYKGNKLEGKDRYLTGGTILTRDSYDNFKGNIYTGYGIYEFDYKNHNLGMIIGGGNSNYKEIKNDTLESITTQSQIKGTTAYLGGYSRINIKDNFSWLNGAGVQYGEYKVNREFKNNYQQENYNSKTKSTGINLYSGLMYSYNLPYDLTLDLKGLLSYSYINQGKIKEENKPLALEIEQKNYNYLDGELGTSLSKTITSSNSKSSLSGGVYYVYGISGYNNKDLQGKFINSTSDMNIKGKKYKKDSAKLVLDYNVLLNSGFNYGIDGTYTTNGENDNISFGIKAGYSF